MATTLCSTCKLVCNTDLCSPNAKVTIKGCEGNGCLQVVRCAENRFTICLGCAPGLGTDQKNSNVSKIEFSARYTDASGNTVVAINVDSVNDPGFFDRTANKYFDLILSAVGTQNLPTGTLTFEVYLTDTTSGRYLLGEGCMNVVPSLFNKLASPVVNVTSTCEHLKLTLDMKTSTYPHADGLLCSFSINWGDGTTQVVDVTGMPTSAWNAEHTYAANYEGDVTIVGTACLLDGQVVGCDAAPTGTKTIKVSMCKATVPVAAATVGATLDTSASHVTEENC